jgi:hypothetical protein
MSGYLLWIRGNRSPEPQKCHEIPLDMNEKPYPFLEKHAITSEQMAKPLNELAKEFPPPQRWYGD